jgi:AraC-like DNA-binding protein
MKVALFIWACFQSLFFGISVFAFRPSRANTLLSAFYVLTALLAGVQYLLRFGGYLFTHGEIAFLSDVINLSFGPVVYLYLQQVLHKRIPARAVGHFASPLLFSLLYGYLLLTHWQPFDYHKYIGTAFHRAVQGGIALSFTFYTFGYNRLLTHAQQGQPAYRREVRNWLYIFLAFFMLKALAAYLVFFRHWLPAPLHASSNQVLEIIFVVIDAIIILTSGMLVLRRTDVLDMERVDLFIQAITAPRKKKASVGIDDATEHITALHRLMDEQRLFTQPDLNEKNLADALHLHPYQLSLLLNDHVGKSFSEYLNERRIDEAKRRLLDPCTANDTIFAIAIDCGYNTESVFYTNFKKLTGTTPRKFQMVAAKNSSV